MPGLSLGWTIGLGLPALLVQASSVALARALRTYSRSRLEEVCKLRGCPDRVDDIERNCDWTERSADALSLLSGFVLATLVGAHLLSPHSADNTPLTGLVLLSLAVLAQLIAGAIGRVWAETLLSRTWPVAGIVRLLAAPLTGITVMAEWVAQRFAGPAEIARPAMLEVEIHPDLDHPEDDETDLPESTRDMIERVVELTRRDVADIMRPRGSVFELSDNVSALEAAQAFAESGFSRIPLFGESRDDIVGVLYAKDLFPAMVAAADASSVSPRKLARTPYFVPETKNANDLLEDFRSERLQMAIVLDEYGAVVGLVTFEDLIEQLVGPVVDEHDRPDSLTDPVIDLGDARYDVDATVPIEALNERLHLHLPTDDDILTIGGYAFHHFGRLPEPGATFQVNGVAFTVTEVVDHSIRRVRLDVGTN